LVAGLRGLESRSEGAGTLHCFTVQLSGAGIHRTARGAAAAGAAAVVPSGRWCADLHGAAGGDPLEAPVSNAGGALAGRRRQVSQSTSRARSWLPCPAMVTADHHGWPTGRIWTCWCPRGRSSFWAPDACVSYTGGMRRTLPCVASSSTWLPSLPSH